jgi:hypothetical protein
MTDMDARSDERSRSVAFISLLIEDVIAARERLSGADADRKTRCRAR